jgi:23S rRNA pseudouridine2604 synthase
MKNATAVEDAVTGVRAEFEENPTMELRDVVDNMQKQLEFIRNPVNGDLVNKILRAGNKHEKEYLVTVNKPLTEDVLKAMAAGVPMLGVTTKKCKIIQESALVFRVVLIQGLNRQIRRMCEYLDYEVKALKRTRIINISLDVHVGRYRALTEDEIKQLNKLIEPSSKTEEASLPKLTQVRSRKLEDGRKGNDSNSRF